MLISAIFDTVGVPEYSVDSSKVIIMVSKYIYFYKNVVCYVTLWGIHHTINVVIIVKIILSELLLSYIPT